MAEGIILNGGSSFDEASVTAVPSRVRLGKRFLGANTDQEQVGSLPEVQGSTYTIGINGRQEVSAGLHNGNVFVRQTGVVVMDGATVYPSSVNQVVQTRNKYMSSDILVSALTGLVPGNIKKGVTIKGVTGTYEGYN